MDKKEKIGYQLLCLALLIAVFVLIWQNKSKSASPSETPVESNEAIVMQEDATYLVLETIHVADFELPQPVQKGGMPLMEALKARKTTRKFSDKLLSDQQISNLLWAANGFNRDEEKRRTAPTASNNQEIETYLFTKHAIYLYDALSNTLRFKREGDFRTQAGKNDFFADAPVALVFVADFDKMEKYDKDSQAFYSATDVGFVSQNVYLFCASEGLATVICGYIDRESIESLLEIKNGKALLSQPVGY